MGHGTWENFDSYYQVTKFSSMVILGCEMQAVLTQNVTIRLLRSCSSHTDKTNVTNGSNEKKTCFIHEEDILEAVKIFRGVN